MDNVFWDGVTVNDHDDLERAKRRLSSVGVEYKETPGLVEPDVVLSVDSIHSPLLRCAVRGTDDEWEDFAPVHTQATRSVESDIGTLKSKTDKEGRGAEQLLKKLMDLLGESIKPDHLPGSAGTKERLSIEKIVLDEHGVDLREAHNAFESVLDGFTSGELSLGLAPVEDDQGRLRVMIVMTPRDKNDEMFGKQAVIGEFFPAESDFRRDAVQWTQPERWGTFDKSRKKDEP